MRIIALSTLKTFWTHTPAYRDAEQPLLAWYRQVSAADWLQPSDVKADFGNASLLQDGRVVFNIAGDKYRLVVWINDGYRDARQAGYSRRGQAGRPGNVDPGL